MSWLDDVIYKITIGVFYGLGVLVASVLAALVVSAFIAAIVYLFGTDTDAVVSEAVIGANHCVFTTSAPEQIVPFLERDDLTCDTITIEIIPL